MLYSWNLVRVLGVGFGFAVGSIGGSMGGRMDMAALDIADVSGGGGLVGLQSIMSPYSSSS